MNSNVVDDGHNPSRMRRIMRFPLTRIVVAIFVTALAGGLTLTFASQMADRWGHVMWPELLAAIAVLLAYRLFVKFIERRQVTELAGASAFPELGAGLLSGAALVTAVIVLLTATGGYQVAGRGGTSAAVITPLAMMVFIGVFEEVLSRGIVFRIVEQSLGSWSALAISSLLFGLAHLPGEGVSALAVVIAVVAGVLFGAAYLATRRLWLSMGMHIGWNYTLGSIFSIAVSGHEATGLLQGTVSGPDWLTGGRYGLEASVLTLVVLVAAAACLLRRAWVKDHLVPGPWRRRLAEPT